VRFCQWIPWKKKMLFITSCYLWYLKKIFFLFCFWIVAWLNNW
jgi:hypothetical protein